jgi:hypothetical protein
MLQGERMRVLTLVPLAVALLAASPARAEDRSFRLVTSAGPTLFALETQLLSPGVLLDLDATAPVGESGIFGLRLAWGLTEFRRTVDVARLGYQLGRWTAHAYEDVVNWAGEDSKDKAGRLLLTIFPLMFLIAPLAIAGSLYLLAPLAATTYLELDAAGGIDLSLGGIGPYFKGGLGFSAICTRPAIGSTEASGPRRRSASRSSASTGIKGPGCRASSRATRAPEPLHRGSELRSRCELIFEPRAAPR